MLAALNGVHVTGLAHLALKAQHNLLGGLCLLVEDGLSLTTITRLLSVVTTLTYKLDINNSKKNAKAMRNANQGKRERAAEINFRSHLLCI